MTNKNDVFQRLRPTCVKLSKEPTRSGVQELRNALCQVEPSCLSKLTEYLLFPLQLTLQRTGIANELKQDTVECIEVILQKVRIDKLNVFDNLFNLLTVTLSSKEAGKVADFSEELKLSIISCLSRLFDSSDLVIRSVVYHERYLPSLGHAVSLLLTVAEHEKAKKLQVAALSCLRKISFCDGELLYVIANGDRKEHEEVEAFPGPEKYEMQINIFDCAASTMASFLPGISMTLTRIISGDPKQGHVVFTSAIDTFGDFLFMVMNDKHMQELDDNEDNIVSTLSALAKLQPGIENKKCEEKANSTEKEEAVHENLKKKPLKVKLNTEWFEATAAKLQVLIEKLTSASIDHSNWRVRFSLVELCKKILMHCTKSMSKSISILVDVLVGFLEDEYTQVSLKSKEILECISKKKIQSGNTSLTSVLEDNLHCQLTALPRHMRTADDKKKLRTLAQLNGYLSLLGDRISLLLTSASHLKRLSLAFIQVLELSVSDIGIVEERTPFIHESAVIPSDTDGENPLSFPVEKVATSQFLQYRFRHFTDDKIRLAIYHSCHLLGCHGNLALLVDHFLDLFHESKVHRKQAVLILNEIMLGCTQNEKNRRDMGSVKNEFVMNDNKLKSIVKILLSTYTSEKNWNLPTSNPSDSAKCTSIVSTENNSYQVNKDMRATYGLTYENLNSNIQLMCLLLEGIGVFALVLRQDFNVYLVDTLYLILSKLGHSNAAISRSAYGTLVLICQSCGYSSVEELITSNADYLVNSIASDFKYVFVNEQSPCVLQVMLQYSSSDILTIIEETLNDVFAVLDLYPEQLMTTLVKVLNALVSSLSKWIVGNKRKQEQDMQKKSSNLTSSSEDQLLQPNEDVFAQNVKNNLQQYIKSKRMALGEVDIEEVEKGSTQDGNEIEDEDPYSPDEKPELPLHVRYATQVLEKCIHFLSSSSSALRILVLDTVYHGVLALKESENDLLPMIHRLWPPLVNRLSDTEQAVIIKVVHVITTMAECSGDFMRRRVIKDVIPRLLTFLEKQAEVSIKAGPVYTHCQDFKLQLASLEGLGRLCKQLEISELDLDAAARVCSLYLSCRQPKVLQQIAVEAFEKFFKLEPDAMWLVLSNVHCPVTPNPPHPMFSEVKLVDVKTEFKDFATNVTFLLSKLDED